MSFVTRYGTQFGAMPQTFGKVFYVAPSASYTVGGSTWNANDANSGLAPHQAVLTISQAQSLATASGGDVIALLPGTHSANAVSLAKAGVTYVGLPYFPEAVVGGYHGWQPATTVTGTTGVSLAVAAADCSFHNIRFLPVTQKSAVSLVTAAARTKFVHCMVDNTGVVGHASTAGIEILTGNLPRGVHFMGCVFKDASVTTSCGAALILGVAKDFWVYKSTIYKDGNVASGITWTAAVTLEDLATGTFEEVNYIGTEVSVPTTDVISGVTMTGAGLVHVLRCTSTVNTSGTLLGNFAAADVDLCLNYVATVAGGSGATLITASA